MADMIEVARNGVQSWEIDQMGHMNVQFYVRRAADGLAALAIRLGLGPRSARDAAVYWRTQAMHVRFLRERRVGAAFFMRAGVVNARADSLRVYLEMMDAVDDTVAAAFTLDVVLRDNDHDQPRPFDETMLRAARALHVERPAHGRPRGVDEASSRAPITLEQAEALGLFTTYQAAIAPAQCDAHGRLSLHQFMAVVSDAVPNLLAKSQSPQEARAEQPGGASLEYRFVIHRYPRAGDTVTVRTGFKAIGEKTYTWCHWLFDLETGQALASADAVGVVLDLESRQAIAVPDTMRARLETLVVNSLGR